MTIALFAYDFPHKKTQDILLSLSAATIDVAYVIASPWEKLPIPNPTVRLMPEFNNLIHPRKLCSLLNINYQVMKHNDPKTMSYLQEHPVDYWVISGARILSSKIIAATNNRIINIHPGLLPEMRGLDTFLWSIKEDVHPGISAHFISPTIDAGELLYRERLELYPDDTVLDVNLRLLERQSQILLQCFEVLKQTRAGARVNLDTSVTKYHGKMSPELERASIKRFSQWRDMHLYEKNTA